MKSVRLFYNSYYFLSIFHISEDQTIRSHKHVISNLNSLSHSAARSYKRIISDGNLTA